jgi:putative DNA primase/helicase
VTKLTRKSTSKSSAPGTRDEVCRNAFRGEDAPEDFSPIRPDYLRGSAQENILTLLATSDEHGRDVVETVPIALWANRIVRRIAEVCYDHWRKYGKAPGQHLPDYFEKDLQREEDPLHPKDSDVLRWTLKNIFALHTDRSWNPQHVRNTLHSFIASQSLKATIVPVLEAIERGDTAQADALIAQYVANRDTRGRREGVQLRPFNTIRTEEIDWLWYEWLARGKLHTLAGPKATLKSTLSLDFAATITKRNGRWPDRTRNLEPLDVLIWSSEDGVADTIKPRLQVAGADLTRVHFVGDTNKKNDIRPFDPAQDMRELKQAADRLGRPIGMLIVDPIVSAIAGDGHMNNEVRRGLQPLVDFAEEFHCAVLGITHFSKNTRGHAVLDRVTGSLAFTAVARVVLAVAKMKEPDEYGRDRVCVRAASNIGPDGGGFYYEPEQRPTGRSDQTAQGVKYRGLIEGNAQAILASAESEEVKPSVWLEQLLEAGPMLADDVFTAAKHRGFTPTQMKNAASYLHVKREKDGLQGGWKWTLHDQ